MQPSTFPRRIASRAVAPLAVVSVIAVLAACAPASTPSDDWSQPEWMQEQSAIREDFVVGVQGCLATQGWDVTIDQFGGAEESFSSQEESERFSVDRDRCIEGLGFEMPNLGTPTVADAELRYGQEVSIRQCLQAQGITMEQEPPPEEVFVEQVINPDPNELGWWAYLDPAVLALDEGEVARLKETCPEPFIFSS